MWWKNDLSKSKLKLCNLQQKKIYPNHRIGGMWRTNIHSSRYKIEILAYQIKNPEDLPKEEKKALNHGYFLDGK